ncbi:bifunctional ADP-dependent NAD(P)H-hydrate dehydratase/NAD(P)H-hydrate epimerase [Corynebacterium frankenforstense]|uniref:bifunctional ADP-dependent NAD(P)H-hydrate dehydratase/NAD(P)H-hydrate epimerase n=1 Tax=Corynebacterium frankenforstense TaxID=1230998 RepID=UPI0026EA82B9|nr:bifunctional ADP-dependent NAD(P)H-hydrate dehydratase/NAD(P)H-hydrate epimerase [Corynebacterium frankenforstense]
MEQLYTVEQVRTAERPLLDAQTEPDELMREAAAAVAATAHDMLTGLVGERAGRVVLLVGSGGNGGDALYAGARLRLDGHRVAAVLLGAHPHERALQALRDAGGEVLEHPGDDTAHSPVLDVDLAVDGITGIGGRPGLRPDAAAVVAGLAANRVPVISVDVPSGIAADTAERLEADLETGAPRHVTATVTVTFGGLRRVHALTSACGEVLLADIGLGGRMLSGTLAEQPISDDEFLTRAVDRPTFQWSASNPARPVAAHRLLDAVEPGAGDDKYTGGVTGIAAGSAKYPGAGVLATEGALRATPAMVRYAGSCRGEVVRAHPEVVTSDTVAAAGRVQSWVVGPGRGTDETARAELAGLLARPEPLVIDADALTVLAGDDALKRDVVKHGNCLLTPHAGEFARIGGAAGPDRITAARDLARELNATVLLKGRLTVVASAELVTVVGSGHSWAATPGSGDVLSGLCGAWLARGGQVHAAAVTAAALHARAAWLAAQTPFGPGPIVASDIAAALPWAAAEMANNH